MACSNEELKEFITKLEDISMLLAKGNAYEYPIGRADGISLNLMMIVTEIREAIQYPNHKFDRKLLSKYSKDMKQAIEDFQFRVTNMPKEVI